MERGHRSRNCGGPKPLTFKGRYASPDALLWCAAGQTQNARRQLIPQASSFLTHKMRLERR